MHPVVDRLISHFIVQENRSATPSALLSLLALANPHSPVRGNAVSRHGWFKLDLRTTGPILALTAARCFVSRAIELLQHSCLRVDLYASEKKSKLDQVLPNKTALSLVSRSPSEIAAVPV